MFTIPDNFTSLLNSSCSVSVRLVRYLSLAKISIINNSEEKWTVSAHDFRDLVHW